LADEERVMKQIQGLVVAATVATASLMAQTAEPPAEVVIKGVAIVDVEAGRLLPDRDIVVRGTRIERVTPSGGPLPRGKTVIDGRGITAAGDVGTDATQLTRWRQDLDAGRLYAPRLAEGCRPAAPTAAGPASRTSPTAPGAIHDDLAGLVSSGRTPAQALRAMTIERARALCLDGLGTVTAGAPADLVVLAGNPLDDIRHTRAIDAVIFRGEVFTQAHVSQLRRGTLPAPTPPR
jgi:imidazolonepropionase-like amidohydrolase